MRRNRPLNGYLDRMRVSLAALDESIEDVRKGPKGEKLAEKRARVKLLRDMIELQNQTLTAIKTHLLGRDETGAPNEPPDTYSGNDQVVFERYFHNMLSPWTEDHLKLECEDCGLFSEEVSNHTFMHPYPRETEYFNLCPKCYDKRTVESTGESENADPVAEPASKGDIRVILQSARLMIRTLKGLPLDQRIAKLEEMLADKFDVAPGMEPAHEAYRALLQNELDKAKAASAQP
ncbi:MAG: hypothetical protein ABSF63_14355 [Candidatus Bathyarchaeia archaeon]